MKKFKKFFKNYILDGIFWIVVLSILIIIFQYFAQDVVQKSDIYQSLVAGIISGIVTAIIIFIMQILWRKNLLIWIENLLYQDVKIEGEWNGFIVPFVGLDELDKIQKDIAWREYKRMRRENAVKNKKKNRKNTSERATFHIQDRWQQLKESRNDIEIL